MLKTGWLSRFEWGVVALAAVVRLLALRAFEATPLSKHPMVDAFVYWDQAGKLLDGRDPFAEGYYQPPAYPWLLSKLGGALGGELTLHDVRLTHAVLGVVTVWLLVRLGRKVGAPHSAPWAGVVAGLLYALYPSVVLFEHDLLTPAVTSVALVGGLSLLWPAAAGALPVWWRAALGGLCLGLAVAVHPTYLLGALVLLAQVAWVGWTTGRRLLPAAALALGVAAPVAPTTVENWRQFGAFELVSHNAGVNFYLGNNPDWVETSFLRPGLPFRQLVLEAEPHKRDAPARNAYWKQRTWNDIANDPLGFVGRLAAKAAWSVSNTEVPRNEDYRCRTRDGQPLAWVGQLPVRYGWVFPIGLVGMLAFLRRREPPEVRALAPLWLALHAPLVLFLVADRYRLATWPVLCLAAPMGAVVIRDVIRAARARLRPSALDSLALLALPAALVLAFWPLDWHTKMNPSTCRYAEGSLHYMEKEYAEAQAAYEDVVREWPMDIGAHYWLAHLAAMRKNEREALVQMKVVLDQFPDHFPSLKSQASWAQKVGDDALAIESLTRAYRVPGDRTSTGTRLVRALLKAGRRDEARALVAADPKLRNHPKLRDIPALQ
jgi:hypothetical protein